MDVSEIARDAFIVGVLLFAVPFPLALVASAVAWAVAGFVAVGSLFGAGEAAEPDSGSPPGRQE